MSEVERIALECWNDRKASQRPSLERPKPIDIGQAVTAALAGIRVIGNAENVRIEKAKVELGNALKYGDRDRQVRAEAQLERALKAAGL
jgi:hypothetical protein